MLGFLTTQKYFLASNGGSVTPVEIQPALFEIDVTKKGIQCVIKLWSLLHIFVLLIVQKCSTQRFQICNKTVHNFTYYTFPHCAHFTLRFRQIVVKRNIRNLQLVHIYQFKYIDTKSTTAVNIDFVINNS